MPHELTLWHALDCPVCMRVTIVLADKGLHYESHVVRLDEVGTEVRLRNPKGQVPVLQRDHCSIYEADVIAEFLEDAFPDPPLFPPSPELRARARLLIRWADAELVPPVRALEAARLRGGPAREPVADEGLQDVLRRAYVALHTIDHTLDGGPYVLGAYTVVDAFLAPFVAALDRIGLRMDDVPAEVVKWIARLRDRPSIAPQVARRLELLGLAGPDELASMAS